MKEVIDNFECKICKNKYSTLFVIEKEVKHLFNRILMNSGYSFKEFIKIIPKFNSVCSDCYQKVHQHYGSIFTKLLVYRYNLDNSRNLEEIPEDIRKRVLQRARYTCEYGCCGKRGTLDIHHIKRRIHGGNNKIKNLKVLCKVHHIIEHNKY